MTLGAAMHRTSLEVLNGDPIDTRRQDHLTSHSAEHGSRLLQSALRLQFRHFAIEHGVTMADARLFCMNSWGPR
jgi:hypothetical protein